MDPDDLSAQQWQTSMVVPTEPQNQAPSSECDDYWFKAEQQQKATRTKGWAKPERELTAAERKKKERKEKKVMESQRYLGRPPEQCAFEHRLRWPKDLPVFRLLGGTLHALDDLRAECKVYIWIEPSSMMIYVAGSEEHSAFTAMNRIKNYIMKRIRTPIDTVCHILEKPSKLIKVHMVKTPPTPYINLPPQITPPQADIVANPAVFMRAKEVETFANLLTLDLSMATMEVTDSLDGHDKNPGTGKKQGIDGADRDDEYVASLKYMEGMAERNQKRICDVLQESLNQVQLLDGEIKMRIRFGQVRFLEYPRDTVWKIKDLDTTVIPDMRLKSEFSPFISRSSDKLVSLAEKLTPPELKGQTMQPEVLWTLGILKRVDASAAHINVQLDVTFRDDEKVSLWNALVQKNTPLDVRVVSPERPLCWAWTISTGKRLEADKFSPEGKFVYELRLEKRKDQESKLVFANTNDIQLRYVRREKKRQFLHDPWTIELIEEAFWTLKTPYKPYQSAVLAAAPDHVLYSVAVRVVDNIMYRDSWVTRFCENPHLSIGQVPTWDPTDFFSGDESFSRTMEAIDNVRRMIEELD
ncbi:hypothetical protein BGZ99_010023 [Dissophora globulifera]|uniref:DUF7905 domain-containing protein n=1 Tax=Dissophora globulifera TaxID=979702 RepID=A0A9P6RYQ3_9FUNG|nr:hypothetical protein BGZ99_010023 [Dissophora globulifera]